ncbi:MAG: hypothetical protein ACYCQK_09050 [Acidiferrobacteraceae bacterium]
MRLIFTAALMTPLLAVAAPRVPLTLQVPATNPGDVLKSPVDPFAVPERGRDDPDPWIGTGEEGSMFAPTIPGVPEARLLLKKTPTECPTKFQWCARQTTVPYNFGQSLGPGIGVKLGRLHFEYAQGMQNRFNFFGVGTSFSP